MVRLGKHKEIKRQHMPKASACFTSEQGSAAFGRFGATQGSSGKSISCLDMYCKAESEHSFALYMQQPLESNLRSYVPSELGHALTTQHAPPRLAPSSMQKQLRMTSVQDHRFATSVSKGG